MELNQVVLNLAEVATEMVEVLGNEVSGFELGKAQICDVFCHALLCDAPAVVIKAEKGNELKYLVYSPLSAQMFITDETIDTPSTLGRSYKNGCLSAIVVEDNGEKTLQLKINAPELLCCNKEKAKNLLTAFLAITYERSIRMSYYRLPLDRTELVPCLCAGMLSWGLTIKDVNRYYGIIINVGSSHIFSIGLTMKDYAEITHCGRYQSKEATNCPSQTYFWNGKIFKPCADESVYMTISEAKETYENLSEEVKEQHGGQIADLFCPVFYQETLYYFIGSAEDNKLLLMDALNGSITAKKQNLDFPACEDICFPTNELPAAKCTQSGWNSSRTAFAQKAAGF